MNLHAPRSRRLVAGLLAGALGLAATPLIGVRVAAAADPLPPLANPLAAGGFCANAPTTNPFNDLGGETASTRSTILCLVATGLTTGTTSSTYTPAGTVTRRQMALFVMRAADLFDELETGAFNLTPLPTYDGTSDYSDVASNDPGAVAIGRLSQADVVGGFPDGTFRPNAPVSRRQMAAFVNNLQKFMTGAAFSTTKDFFTDDQGDAGAANLNALASVGIFQGDGQGQVFPGLPLSRRQMANILLRYAQVALAAGIIESPFAPPSNATFDVTPRTALTRELVTEPNGADDRLYEVTGLQAGTSYTIQLFPAANVQGSTTRTFTEAGATNTADDGTVAADVTVVNGTAVPGADDNHVAQVVNGGFSFTVDGSALETVVPVVFRDADADGKVDLKADNTPVATEPFGVGGATRYLPAEAGSGSGPFTVTAITTERDAFTSGGLTYFFDANDTYRLNGSAITRAQFDSMLSVGDAGTVTYSSDPTGVSIFNMTTDDVDAPATPTIAIVDDGPGNTVDDARITYTRPATNSPGVTYSLRRATVDDGLDNSCGSLDDTPGTFANVPSASQAAGSGSGVFVFSDDNLANGCYTYRIRATSPVSLNTADSAAPAATPVPPAGDTTAPISTFARRTTNANTAAFDSGDVVKVVFNEPMAVPAGGSFLRLSDADATLADMIALSNATFALNLAPEVVDGTERPVGTVLTITLSGPPTTYLAFIGAVPGLQAPATVQDRSGIFDVAGNAWSLPTSSDVIVDSV